MSGFRKIISRRSLAPLLAGTVVGTFVGFVVATVIWFSVSPVSHQQNFCDPHVSNDLADAKGPQKDVGFHSSNESVHAHENNTTAQKLHQEVKILCLIMTSPKNHQTKAQHVKKTWGTRCNKLIFMSTVEDLELGSVALPVKEGRDNLWAKTKEAFKYIYKHHITDADWFLKADDDTYVILENLRYMLYPYSPSSPLYIGCKFKEYVKQGYMSGGAGYVLSKELVRRFVEDGIPDKDKCLQTNDGAEDVEIGKCLEKLNGFAVDSRDSLLRGRFFPFVPEHHLIPGHVDEKFWFWKYIFYETAEGLDCCSDNAVSFHYVSPNHMYVLEYLIYHLRPYGIVFHSQPLPDKVLFSDLVGDEHRTSKLATESKKQSAWT